MPIDYNPDELTTTYILMLGRPVIGKTAFILSMINYLKKNGYGTLFADQYHTKSATLTSIEEGIDDMFKYGKFPKRTKVGDIADSHWEFRPNDKTKPAMYFSFIDMSGEDFRAVGRIEKDKVTTQNEVKITGDMDDFLKSRYNLIFLLMTSYKDAEKDDELFYDFIQYVNHKERSLLKKPILMLITQWDTKPYADKMNPVQFVQRKMEATYNLLKNSNNTVAPFSVGKVSQGGWGDRELEEQNRERPEAVMKWLYKAITQQNIEPDPPPKKWWEKVLDNWI